MKSSLLKKITALALVSVLTIGAALSASAEILSPRLNTSSGTAGSWTKEPAQNLKSKEHNKIYGGDVGVWVFTTNVGLSRAFERSNERTAHLELWEQDAVLFGIDRVAQYYTMTFATVNGYYQPYYTENTSTNGSEIENDNNAELYLKWRVNTMSGDTSKSVPSGLINYQIWLYE